MYSNSTFLTPSTSNLCLCVLNNRLPRLARYLQAVFIVTNSFGSLNKLELKLELHTNQAAKTGGKETAFLMVSWHSLFCYLLYCGYAHIQDSVSIFVG